MPMHGHHKNITGSAEFCPPAKDTWVHTSLYSKSIDCHTLDIEVGSQPRMLPELPNEIWILIASYVPDTDLRRLYSLNQLFYELALNVLYKELRVLRLSNGLIFELLSARAPRLSKRIQQFELDLYAFQKLERSSIQQSSARQLSWRQRLKSTFNFFPRRDEDFRSDSGTLDPLGLTSKSVDEVFHILLEVVRHMENVRHCKVAMCPALVAEHHLEGLRDIWRLLSGRIQSLSLYTSASKLRSVRSIFNSLPPLDRLHIYLDKDSTSWSTTTAADLAGLYNDVAETLESFGLTAHPWTTVTEFGLIFRNLGHFVKLKRVDLDTLFEDTSPDTAQFINTHGNGIEELSLVPYASTGGAVTPLAALQLPVMHKLHLATYNLSGTSMYRFWSGTLGFAMLNHLTIYDPILQHDQVSLICDTFGRSGIGNQLRHLLLDIWIVTGQVLDSLAHTFPHLHALSIRSRFLLRASRENDWDIKGFADEMEPRRYTQWTLYDVTFTPSCSASAYATYAVMQIVAKCTPSVQSFCGTGNMNVPSVIRDQLVNRTTNEA